MCAHTHTYVYVCCMFICTHSRLAKFHADCLSVIHTLLLSGKKINGQYFSIMPDIPF